MVWNGISKDDNNFPLWAALSFTQGQGHIIWYMGSFHLMQISNSISFLFKQVHLWITTPEWMESGNKFLWQCSSLLGINLWKEWKNWQRKKKKYFACLRSGISLTLWLPHYYLQSNGKGILPLTSKTHSCNFNSLLLTRNVEFNVAYKIINMTNITE